MRLARFPLTLSVLAFVALVAPAQAGKALPKKFLYSGGPPSMSVGAAKKGEFTFTLGRQAIECQGGTNEGNRVLINGVRLTKEKQARIGKTYGVTGAFRNGGPGPYGGTGEITSGKVFFKSKKKAIAKNLSYKEERALRIGGGTCEVHVDKVVMKRQEL